MPEKPTLASVAQAAGVSIPTVSQVIRGTGRISEDTRRKVLQVARALHYLPDSRAASFRSGERREVGFVLNRFANPFNAEVVSGAIDLLEAAGYLVSILDTRDDAERQSRQLDALIGHARGGLLWVPAFHTTKYTVERLRTHSIPTVTFLRPVSSAFDHVGICNAEATQKATEHLIKLGHRNVAYFGGVEQSTVRLERIEGYERALRAQGLGPGIVWSVNDSRGAAAEAIVAFRLAHPEVTALICNGDVVALGVCHGLKRAGVEPGREMAVIGFDDIEEASLASPSLSTMSVSPASLGRILARTLLERIQNPDIPPVVTKVTAELVVRESSGAELK